MEGDNGMLRIEITHTYTMRIRTYNIIWNTLVNSIKQYFHICSYSHDACAVSIICSMSLLPSIALFLTHLYLLPLFPIPFMCMKWTCRFCKITFSLMIEDPRLGLNFWQTTSAHPSTLAIGISPYCKELQSCRNFPSIGMACNWAQTVDDK